MNIRDVLIRKKEKLRLDLNSIHSPSKYGLSFYTSESFKSNEVRDFTRWVAVPPSAIDVGYLNKHIDIIELEHPELKVLRDVPRLQVLLDDDDIKENPRRLEHLLYRALVNNENILLTKN